MIYPTLWLYKRVAALLAQRTTLVPQHSIQCEERRKKQELIYFLILVKKWWRFKGDNQKKKVHGKDDQATNKGDNCFGILKMIMNVNQIITLMLSAYLGGKEIFKNLEQKFRS